MIKGCNKRVIWIRNTENDLFEQAYFILSDSAQAGRTEGDIIKEAKKIINDSPVCNYWEEPRAARKYAEKRAAARSRRGKLLFFAFGFALGAIPAVLLLIL